MKSTPILYTGDMVRAKRDGRKTETRRIAKLNHDGHVVKGGKRWHTDDPNAVLACPYGQVGCTLWTKETYRTLKKYDSLAPRDIPVGAPIFYEADGDSHEGMGRIRQSIFMRKWMSRMEDEITGIRLERVRDITAEGAIAEGIEPAPHWSGIAWRDYSGQLGARFSPIQSYRTLFQSINGPDSWSKWVWVVQFKRKEVV